jgi:hypothetical protein
MRYDKAQNFDLQYIAKSSLVYSGGESRRHNFRGSFQTGLETQQHKINTLVLMWVARC